MTYTNEQIAEALKELCPDCKMGKEIASALRAAQERIKQMEVKTVPMEMLRDIWIDGYDSPPTWGWESECLRDGTVVNPHSPNALTGKAQAKELAKKYDYTVTESTKEKSDELV